MDLGYIYLKYGSFCEIDAFPLNLFSIRNFNLCNLKGNGIVPTGSCICYSLHSGTT